MTTRTYEFTAFQESDLVSGNLNCGSSFKMPEFATVCISVRDDDRFLSGDSRRNEQANDHYGQQATIDLDGTDIGNGGQIYAEGYWALRGSDGRTYYLIEIEQEGTNDDFFAFYGAVPPAGVHLEVAAFCNIKKDWVDYKCLGAGDKPETGSIEGTVFCDVDCDGINGEIKTIPGCDYVVEAEDMHDYGFRTVHGDHASGGELVKLNCAGGYGKLWTCFDGKTGIYDVKIRVQDENDGRSVIKLLIDGVFVEAVRLDRNSDGRGDDDGGFSTFVVKDVVIDHGDQIKLLAWGDGGEFVRIDNISLHGQDRVVRHEEPVKEGVTIKLLDGDGRVVDTTVTDANGDYRFDDVPVGHYKIMGVAPDGTEFTIKDAGSDDRIDSDVDENGLSDVIKVTADETTDIDLGLCDKPKLGSLSGRYFCDVNDNDVDDAEPGIAGVLVTLLDAAGEPVLVGGNPVTTTTDGTGAYSFGSLEAGPYGVRFTDPDGALDGKQLVNPNVGGDDAIDSDAIGDTTLSEIRDIVVVAGANTPDNDAGAEKTAALGDKVFFDDDFDGVQDAGEGGVAGVTVTLTGGGADGVIGTADDTTETTVTDGNGMYLFEGLNPGEEYKVTFEAATLPADTAFTEADQGGDDALDSDADPATGMTQIVTLASGETNRTLDAGIVRLAGLGDFVFEDLDADGVQDAGEAGIEGATVKLLADLDNDGQIDDVADTTTTDANGGYAFTGLRPGDYKVMFVLPDGFTEVSPFQQGGDAAADSDADPNNGLMSNVVSLDPGEFDPTVDAGFFNLAGLGDFVFLDDDRDGIQDAGEAGVENVAVSLKDSGGTVIDTTTTDGTGFYSFTGLRPGSYSVQFVAPAGFFLTTQNAGADDALDSDADPATGMTQTVTLVSDEFNPTLDAGLVRNRAPEPTDDTAMVCDGEMTTISGVSDDPADPDGDAVTLVAVRDAGADGALGTVDDVTRTIATGDTVTLSSGAELTANADGTFKYDVSGADDFDDLLIGDTAGDSFVYIVEDSRGASAEAQVDVTVKGALNTIETITDRLPDTAKIDIDVVGDFGGVSDSTVAVDFDGDGVVVGDADSPADGVYTGFCIELPDGRNDEMTDAFVYSSYDDLESISRLDGDIDNRDRDTFERVNYILNLDNLDDFAYQDVQDAIWALTTDETAASDLSGDSLLIYNDAIANGDDFEPESGDFVGVIFEPVDAAGADDGQVYIVAIPFDSLAEECVCP